MLVSGCGTKTVDTGRIERQLSEQVAASSGVDPADVKVNCPRSREGKPGLTFDCIVKYDGTRRAITITLGDGDRYTATLQTNTTPPLAVPGEDGLGG